MLHLFATQSQAAVPPPPLSDLKEYCLKLQSAVACEEARHEHEARVSLMFAAAAADSSKAARLRGMISASRRVPQQHQPEILQLQGSGQQQSESECVGGSERVEGSGGSMDDNSSKSGVNSAGDARSGGVNSAGEAGVRSSSSRPPSVPSSQTLRGFEGVSGMKGNGGGVLARLANARGAVERALPLLPLAQGKGAHGSGSGVDGNRNESGIRNVSSSGSRHESSRNEGGRRSSNGGVQEGMGRPGSGSGSIQEGVQRSLSGRRSIDAQQQQQQQSQQQGQSLPMSHDHPVSAHSQGQGSTAEAAHHHTHTRPPSGRTDASSAAHTATGPQGHTPSGSANSMKPPRARTRPSSAARLRALVSNPPALPGEADGAVQGSVRQQEVTDHSVNSKSSALASASVSASIDFQVDSLKGGVAAILSKHGLKADSMKKGLDQTSGRKEV